METQPTTELKEWPFEYGDWRITFTVETWIMPNDGKKSVLFPSVKVEHLHKHPKQSVRWTKHRNLDKKSMTMGPLEDELCCFICAEYMPDETWEYFERCKEITRCANL